MKEHFSIDADTFVVAGRTVSEWRGFDHVLAAHNVTTPKQLNERLGRKAPERRVKVFDAVNQDRLLGTISVPSTTSGAPYISFAVMPHETIYGYCPPYERVAEMKVSTVEMRAITRSDLRTWTSEFALVTHDPLSLLMQMRGFRLPGETEAQAEDRRWRS